MNFLKNLYGSRRELFRNGGLLTAAGLFKGSAASLAAAPPTASIYDSVGVRPVINCYGVMTIIGGSLTLPEVKRAMDDASRHYVHLDELAEGVGKKLAQLTGAEWGIVTAGCAAAMTHATSACIAGGDPEKLQKLPDLTGLKSEVIIPRYCRNVYDHAVRMLGVKIVEPATRAEYEAAFSDRTAMVYALAPNNPELGLETLASIAKQKKVPVLVDAAAERLTIPNEYLKRGANMVAYSGGKLLRGPQCAGLLLGQKNLLQAAWYNSAPHHAFGRSLKVGKEEMMGMVAAVEMWTKRDHAAEWKEWQSWVRHIADRVQRVPGVKAEIAEPTPGAVVSPAPRMRITWDADKFGFNNADMHALLLEGEPRIVVPPANRRDTGNVISITPVMMSAGDEKLVAERLYAIFSKPPKITRAPAPSGPAANVAGQWSAHLDFVVGDSDHTLVFEQQGNEIRGTHKGRYMSGDLRGFVEGNTIRFRSSHKFEGSYLNYEFTGKVENGGITGTVDDMSTITPGEFGVATWAAQRRQYTEPNGRLMTRPQKLEND